MTQCSQGILRADGSHETRCPEEAVARFRLDAGCVAQPGEREQDLCLHHVMRASPLGTFELVEDYSEGEGFTRWWQTPWSDRVPAGDR